MGKQSPELPRRVVVKASIVEFIDPSARSILLRVAQEISKRPSYRVPLAEPTKTAQPNTVRLRVDETPQVPGLSTYYYCLGKYTHSAAAPAFSGSFFQLPVCMFNTQTWGRTSIKGWARHVTCKDTPISSFYGR